MAIQYQVYFKIPGGDWVNVENTYETSHKLSDELQAVLDYFSVYQWRVDTYDTETGLTTTGDTWTFVSQNHYLFTEQIRRSDYNENYVWDPGINEWNSETEEWNPAIGEWVNINDFGYTGGGRYNNRIVVVGHNCIYFGDA